MLGGLLIGLFRDRDAAGRGNGLEADRDVDAIPEHFVLVGDHVPHMDAQAEPHGSIRGQMGVAFRHQRLRRDRAFDGADDAWKFQQETIAGVLHDSPAVIEDDRINRAAVGLERGVRAFFVGAHHARVACDVGANDGGEASFHLPLCSRTSR